MDIYKYIYINIDNDFEKLNFYYEKLFSKSKNSLYSIKRKNSRLSLISHNEMNLESQKANISINFVQLCLYILQVTSTVFNALRTLLIGF